MDVLSNLLQCFPFAQRTTVETASPLNNRKPGQVAEANMPIVLLTTHVVQQQRFPKENVMESVSEKYFVLADQPSSQLAQELQVGDFVELRYMSGVGIDSTPTFSLGHVGWLRSPKFPGRDSEHLEFPIELGYAKSNNQAISVVLIVPMVQIICCVPVEPSTETPGAAEVPERNKSLRHPIHDFFHHWLGL